MRQALNHNMNQAKARVNDEFYTLYSDIEKELAHYHDQLVGKVVYCNCDHPERSEFVHYFKDHYHDIGLGALISSFYSKDEEAYVEYYDGQTAYRSPLDGHGDFRDEELSVYLGLADVVVTNPPFSLFREFTPLMEASGKDYLLVGNQNAVTYKDVFPLIQSERLSLGHHTLGWFRVPNKEPNNKKQKIVDGVCLQRFGNVIWFTTLKVDRGDTGLVLTKSYHADPSAYPRYDNYDAIEVSKVADIPYDYDGVMGVPITYLNKHDPKGFEVISSSQTNPGETRLRAHILGTQRWAKTEELMLHYTGEVDPPESDKAVHLNGKELYDRVFICLDHP